jgi:predicted transcriptional regulatory protein
LKTAEELYIHENTLRYRLHQIEDVMDCDLKNVNTITDIVTALKVRRMLQILDKV